MTSKDEFSSVQIEARISQFEKKLDRLYRQFEQYFVGVEKRPPHHGRREVMRLFRELDQMPMIRTDLKFRFRGLTQRLTTYKTYWTRVERQIEDGTYHRDLARAKARQQRRAELEEDAAEEEETAVQQDEERKLSRGGQAEDGVFELDGWDLEELDLSSLEQEFEEMDQRGEFERYVGTQKIRQPFPADEKPAEPARSSQSYRDANIAPEVDPTLKKKRLAELQAKLGLSTSASLEKKNPFERSQEGVTKRARPENPTAPSRGADISKLRKLQSAKERIQAAQERPQTSIEQSEHAQTQSSARAKRVIQRIGAAQTRSAISDPSAASAGLSDERSRKIYDTLLQAKKRCNEDTSKLNYNTFKTTIERQRVQIQRNKGARDVDFRVVIKNGRAFLKPETKD